MMFRSASVIASLLFSVNVFAQTESVEPTAQPVDTTTSTPVASEPGVTEPASAAAAPASTAAGGEERGAAATAPVSPTDKDAQSDAALAALGVGEYGKRSEMFVLWENDSTGAYIKPIVWVSASVMGYFPQRAGTEYADRAATMLVSRFGFEGALTDWASFKLEFQRDLGFSLASNGPQGTSVFEGTAAIQARENYINLHKWGFILSGGIQTDPASVDFISPHVLGLFGMDPYTRDYLLNSGFGLGQGVMLRYEEPFLKSIGAGRLTVGLQFTSGNPLTTSLSYGFGGNVTQNGTLYTAPLRSVTSGIPGSNILLTTVSPSIVYSVEFAPRFGFDLRAAAQLYNVDVDTTLPTDAKLNGSNFRGTGRIRLPYVNIMGGFARRVNQQLALPDLSTRNGDKFEGTVWSLGAEVNYGRFGLGGHYAFVKQEQFEGSFNKAKYLNVAFAYQLVPSFLSASLRYASVSNDYEAIAAVPTDAKSIIAALALTI